MAPASPAMLAPAPFAGDPNPPTKGRQKVADHRTHQGQGDKAGHRRRSRVGEQPSQPIADPAVRLSGDLGIGSHGIKLHHPAAEIIRSEEHTSELQSLMRISYAVF